MACPHFEILRFGVYDSARAKSTQTESERLVTNYEFEFYAQDCPGGQMADRVLYPAKAGGCTLFKPGQKQKTVLPYKCYFMNIITEDPELQHFLEHLPVYFTVWNLEQIVALFHAMLAVESKDTLAGRMELQSCACRILGALEQYSFAAKQADRNVLRHQQVLLMADRYICKHVNEDLSLNRLAKLCNLDATYFHKLYTAAFGRTPAQRVLSQRIVAAKREIVFGNSSLEEIAERCGFSSQTYFCYQFKKATGYTPRQYRHIMLTR